MHCLTDLSSFRNYGTAPCLMQLCLLASFCSWNVVEQDLCVAVKNVRVTAWKVGYIGGMLSVAPGVSFFNAHLYICCKCVYTVKDECLSPELQSKITTNIKSFAYYTQVCWCSVSYCKYIVRDRTHTHTSLKHWHRFMAVFTTWSCVFSLQCSCYIWLTSATSVQTQH